MTTKAMNFGTENFMVLVFLIRALKTDSIAAYCISNLKKQFSHFSWLNWLFLGFG
jgi:hypothetical protein